MSHTYRRQRPLWVARKGNKVSVADDLVRLWRTAEPGTRIRPYGIQ
jgi:hypothetical protein